MGLIIAGAIVWFWSESCFTKQERKTRRRLFWGANALITAKTLYDIANIDKTTKF